MTGVWWDATASLLLGSACPGCQAPSARLCPACAAQVGSPVPFVVEDAGWTPTVAAADYGGVWRDCLVAYKERSAWWLAQPLGAALGLAVAAALACADAPGAAGGRTVSLVPVPSQAVNIRERGLDTTRALAQEAARVLRRAGVRTTVVAPLRHARRVADQSELGVGGRWANVAGAFRARPVVADTVVLVDDLTTTGASLTEAARALDAVGAPPVGCAVVAATPRLVPPGGMRGRCVNST